MGRSRVELIWDGQYKDEDLTGDVARVKALADAHRYEVGFIPLAALKEAAAENRLLVVRAPGSTDVVGFVHFRCCKDGHATIYEIAVAPQWRGQGIGRRLVEAVIAEAQKHGCYTLRLRCPVDLPANGFYARMGFVRIAVEAGKRRPLAVWEFPITSVHSALPSFQRWQFYAALTAKASDIRTLVHRYFASYDGQSPFNPFKCIIVSPLFAPNSTLHLLCSWRDGNSVVSPQSLMFDSGGYQVQMGKLTYGELCQRLRQLYDSVRWADFYVLPDHVPVSRDTDSEVANKVTETLAMGELFLRWLPYLQGKAVGVVHGRTERQVRWAARRWHELGVHYIAFGSFGTSGPNGSVNLLSKHSLKLLKVLCEEAAELRLRLHVFGIGNPTYLLRFMELGIEPTSFDSTGWWKMGGFGYVFVPDGEATRSYGICLTKRMTASITQVHRQLIASGHQCPFCADPLALQRSRWHRVLHNLVVFGETVRKVTETRP